MNMLSGFLFARPSFTEGVSRIMDFGNTLSVYNACETPAQADYWAIYADWKVVGMDLEAAIQACVTPGQAGVRHVQGEAKKAAAQAAGRGR